MRNTKCVWIAALSIGILSSGCGQPADLAESTPPCTAPASWFEGAPQPPDFQAFPANASNCDFHLWAWQEALYLATPDSAGVRPFEALAQPHNLFVSSGEPGPYPGGGSSGPRLLSPRRLKMEDLEEIDAILQAGGGVLFDQMNQVVYYEARVDKSYYDFIAGNGFFDPNKIVAAPADSQFPVGSLELKLAWRVASTADETYIDDAATRFITSQVMIEPVIGYDEQTKQYVVDSQNPIAATVALVGLHVVGHVEGHPEFIWATFEHQDNAPDIGATPVNGPGPTGPWSFYEQGTPCAGGECNQQPKRVPAKPLFPATDVCRVQPQGAGDATNTANIVELNKSVHAQLKDPVLGHYFLVGGLWTNMGELPPSDTNQKGSLKLANTTLETYFQGPPPASAPLLNCFSCHSESPPPGVTQKFPNWPKNFEPNFSHLLALSVGYKE